LTRCSFGWGGDGGGGNKAAAAAAVPDIIPAAAAAAAAAAASYNSFAFLDGRPRLRFGMGSGMGMGIIVVGGGTVTAVVVVPILTGVIGAGPVLLLALTLASSVVAVVGIVIDKGALRTSLIVVVVVLDFEIALVDDVPSCCCTSRNCESRLK